MIIVRAALAALLLTGAAHGAEYLTGGAGAAPLPQRYDGEYELKWDNGRPRWPMCWYTGAGSGAFNDFDVSTLKSSHVFVTRLGVYSQSGWPNGRWDGFRIALYSFRTVPGVIIWPESGTPKYVKPSGYEGWKWFNVNWVLPKSSYSFMAGMEQRYNHPNCDPFHIDDNPTYNGHSWLLHRGLWFPWQPWDVYRNIMIRVRVETGRTFPGVAPTSVGRVKALYY